MNRTIEELVDVYKADYMVLEESYADLAGRYPGPDDRDFWECQAVRKVDCLLHLWWDIRDYRDGIKNLEEPYNEETGN